MSSLHSGASVVRSTSSTMEALLGNGLGTSNSTVRGLAMTDPPHREYHGRRSCQAMVAVRLRSSTFTIKGRLKQVPVSVAQADPSWLMARLSNIASAIAPGVLE